MQNRYLSVCLSTRAQRACTHDIEHGVTIGGCHQLRNTGDGIPSAQYRLRNTDRGTGTQRPPYNLVCDTKSRRSDSNFASTEFRHMSRNANAPINIPSNSNRDKLGKLGVVPSYQVKERL
jgi:hypothetical protein